MSSALPALLLLIGLVLSPNLAWLWNAPATSETWLKGMLPALVGAALLLSLFSRLWLTALFLGALTLPTLLETWYVVNFGRPSDAHLLGIVLESDAAEILTFVRGLWGHALATLLLALGLGAWTTRRLYRTGLCWPTRPRRMVLGGSLAGLLLLNSPLWLPEPEAAAFNQDTHSDLTRLSMQERLSTYAASWPTGLPVRIFSAWRDHATLQRIKAHLQEFSFGATRRANASSPPLVVLVIGETGRPDRWQLFGYARETTPRLAQMDNLLPFTDVVSPWSWTRMALPVILTRKSPTESSPYFAERSFIAAFNEVGYESHWLSNQNALGEHESSTSLYAYDAHTVRFFNPASYKHSGTHDDVLLAPLTRILQAAATEGGRTTAPTLMVLHTLGSHFDYSHRYPAPFRRFLPDRPEEGSLSLHDARQQEEQSNAYDNSVLFTDHVLGEIIDRLAASAQSAVLLYVADHGENLFADGCGLSGHGHETDRDFRIPMLLWWSDEFARQYPGKIARARANAGKPISTTAIFPSLLDLADIILPDTDPRLSVFSDRYTPSPRWVFAAGHTDFDTAPRDPACKQLHH